MLSNFWPQYSFELLQKAHACLGRSRRNRNQIAPNGNVGIWSQKGQKPPPLRKALFRIPRCVIMVFTHPWAGRVLSEGQYEQ